MTSFVRRWQTEENDTYVLSLVRAAMGVFLLVSAIREARAIGQEPHFADVFHLPSVPAAFVPGSGVFAALLVSQLVLAVLVVAGRFARPALLASASIGIYLLLCDRLAYHNNRYALFLFSFLLAFAPCDRAFVWPQRATPLCERRGPLWAARLVQLQMSIIYLASGGSKLVDPDWRGGLVLGDRLVRATSLAVARGVPSAVMDVLSHPLLASTLSKLAIGTELFLAVGLFVPRTRFVALWWGVMFHLTIEATSRVELFTWMTLAVYALFAVPALRERTLIYDPTRPFFRRLAALVRRLDWLARFDVRADATAARASGFVVVARDGSRASGLLGYARIARATPLFFPLSLPLLTLARVQRRHSEDARAAAC